MVTSAQTNLILERCQTAIPEWRRYGTEDFDFDDPKGFSSFTVGVRCRRPSTPESVLYRAFDEKENAILDAEGERATYLLLAEEGIAARCFAYESGYRIEEFYEGRSLDAGDLSDSTVLRGIARQLHRVHHLPTDGLPGENFFELLHRKWGRLGRRVLAERSEYDTLTRAMCDELDDIYSDTTASMVQRCLPEGPTVFCHNDTYHGNVMQLVDGRIRLVDFEFSCRNHRAFDFANLFAETAMRHGLDDPPHFRIAEPTFSEDDVDTLVGHYLDCGELAGAARRRQHERLVADTLNMVLLSHYMYAMAAIPLARNPVQKIDFIPYAHARFAAFRSAYRDRFGEVGS